MPKPLKKFFWALALVLVPLSSQIWAAHCACAGESFPGAALGAEPLAKGSTALTLGFGWTGYEQLSKTDLAARASQTEDHQVLGPEQIMAQSFALAFGVSEDWQLALQTGFQRAEAFKEGWITPSGSFYLQEHGDISGVTDSALQLKGRMGRLAGGDWALVLGAILPTGQSVNSPLAGVDPQTLSPTGGAAELPRWIEPGKGSLDFSLALAWSKMGLRWLTDFSLSQSIPSTTRGYKAGERTSLGLSAAWLAFPTDWLYLDFVWARAESDNFDGRTVAGTGGAFGSLGPRLVHDLGVHLKLSAEIQAPVLYDLAGGDTSQSGLRAQWQGALKLIALY
jgi:hypothetical protein